MKHANPRKHFDQSKNPPETSSLMSEQANQLHNPPVMFNEREITFYTFLHSCGKHAVFFVCVGVIGISIIIVSCGFGGKTIHSGAEIMQP